PQSGRSFCSRCCQDRVTEVGELRPKVTEGAKPRLSRRACSRPATPPPSARKFRRTAPFSENRRLLSSVLRRLRSEPYSSMPSPMLPSANSPGVGVLVWRFTYPPAPPRPLSAAGPLTTSTCPGLQASRADLPESRTPSTKMLPLVLKPRRLKSFVLLPKPFSPALKLMPGVLRRMSVRFLAPCSWKPSRGITEMVCGVSSSGAVAFGDEGSRRISGVAVTETAGRVALVCAWVGTADRETSAPHTAADRGSKGWSGRVDRERVMGGARTRGTTRVSTGRLARGGCAHGCLEAGVC